MADQTFLVHVGFPKTGTTTLQGAVFQKAPNVHYFGKFVLGEGNRRTKDPWHEPFRDLINYGTDADISEQGPGFARSIEESIRAGGASISVLSLEGLTNPLADHGPLMVKDSRTKARHLSQVLAPLRDRGITLRILISLRDQAALIPSYFTQVYLQGFAVGLWDRSYGSFLDAVLQDTPDSLGPDFCYDRVLDAYHVEFGPRGVITVVMDQMMSGAAGPGVGRLAQVLGYSHEGFAAALSGTRANVRQGAGGAQAGRRMMVHSTAVLNHAAKSGTDLRARAFGRLDRARIALGRPVHWAFEPQAARIAEFYAASNARLLDRYGLSLGPQDG